jgi:hypothetical protein
MLKRVLGTRTIIREVTMTKRLYSNSLAVLLVSCLWASEAGAISVSYDYDSHALDGRVTLESKKADPFAAGLRSIWEQDEEQPRSPRHMKYHQLWDRHHGHEYDQDDRRDGHGDTWYGENDLSHHTHSKWHYSPKRSCPNPVPVPAALWLFLSGLTGLGLAGISRRR